MLEAIQRKIWSRKWSSDDVRKYVGDFRSVFFSYAADPAMRRKAASGGSVTALLTYLLERGEIDAAVVLKTVVTEGKAGAKFVLARTPEEIRECQGSKYESVRFTHEVFPLIRDFQGRVGLVALPCDARIVADYRRRNRGFDEKIALVITLFCGHNSEPVLRDEVLRRMGNGRGGLVDFTYRFGHWRGQIGARFENGDEVVRPFREFSDYQNLYFFSQRKCHHCIDHTGYHGDISAGDIWSRRMMNHPIKHTALIVRTEVGERVVHGALETGVLVGKVEPIGEVLDGQARTLPFHYNVSARSRVGVLLGENIKDTVRERVRWNDFIVAFMVLMNERISRTRLGRAVIFRIPRPLLRGYLLLLKGLESL